MADDRFFKTGAEPEKDEEIKKVLVSVVMPAYRCADTIGKAVDSVLSQEVPLELIVLNDCSPDNLDTVMKRYETDARVRYLKNNTNLGAAATRNRGVKLAHGDYIAFLDADDWWESGKLRRQLALIEQEQAVLCATGRELVTPDGHLTGRVISVSREITFRSLMQHNSINCSSVLIRKEAALEFPMEHEDSHEDYITWLRVLNKYGKACAINEPLLKYRLSASGKSGSKRKSAAMTYKAYRYFGFGRIRSLICFCMYAFNGVRKYAAAYRNGRKKRSEP